MWLHSECVAAISNSGDLITPTVLIREDKYQQVTRRVVTSLASSLFLARTTRTFDVLQPNVSLSVASLSDLGVWKASFLLRRVQYTVYALTPASSRYS